MNKAALLFESFNWTQFGLAVVLALPFLFYLQSYPNYRNPNELSRLLLSSAIVDDGSLQIDGALKRFGDCQDISFYNGHYYTNKAIGYSFLAVPFYWAFRVIGYEQVDLLIYVLRVLLNVIPLILFCTFFLHCLQKELQLKSFAYVLCIALLYGSLIFTYTQMFASHMLTGLIWFLAFHVTTQRDGRQSAFIGGALLGISFLLEIPSLVLFPLFFLWILLHNRRLLPGFVAGAALFSLPAFVYNYAIFGHPFKWAYQFVATPELQAVVRGGYVGVSTPSMDVLYKLTFGSNRGFFHFMPHLLLGLFGMLRGIRSSAKNWLIPAIFGATVLFYSGFASWDGGWSFGPRFLVSLIPLFVYATGQWFAFPDESSFSYHASILIYLILLAVTIPFMVMGASTFPLSPRFLPLILVWEVPVLFWRGFFGLHLGDLFGMSEGMVQAVTILLVILAIGSLLIRARWSRAWSAIFISATLGVFLLTAAVTGILEAQMPAVHCLAIGRIGYIQAQYAKARVFLQYARERTSAAWLRQESGAWERAIDDAVKKARQP